MKPGIANVYLCGECGAFQFIKPESDRGGYFCPNCDEPMDATPDQAVIEVRHR